MSFRSWAVAHGVRWHATDDNDDHRAWAAGRAWINLSTGDGDTGRGYRELLEIRPEWHIGKARRSAGLGLQLGGGDSSHEIMLHVDLGLARFYLSFDSPYFRRPLERILPGRWVLSTSTYRASGRFRLTLETEIDFRFHDGAFYWSLWHPTMEWDAGTPRWRHGSFDVVDFLLGRRVHTTRVLKQETTLIPMPEGTYPATVELREAIWKRPRWPFALRRYLANVEVEQGIPHPGKGENSWDCGDDATYSLSCSARTIEDAVAAMVRSVLRDRRRYGGHNWRPRPPQPQAV